jgi:alpha-1,2-mannosyltransferase
MRDNLRSGAWLTPERLRRYPFLLCAFLLAAMVLLVATGKGDLDAFGRPIGTDFAEVWIAGLEVDQGRPAQPYDNAAHFAGQEAWFGAAAGAYVWPYPPYFLAPAALMGLLPYLPALALWQLITLALYLTCQFAILLPTGLPRSTAAAAALGFPAVFINLAHGQNGFLTTALLAGGLLLVRPRPVLGGLLFGLLAYKPQFGLVIPIALLAAGRWRTFAAAAGTVITMAVATLIAFGTTPWEGFFAGTSFTRKIILEQGGLSYDKMQSMFAATRLLGGPVFLAYVVQAATAGAVVAAVVWLWRTGCDERLKAAALLVASLLASPYVLDYDMVVLAPALALALAYGLEKGFGPYEKSALAIVWIMPLFARPLAGAIALPIGAPTMLLFFGGLLLCGRREMMGVSSEAAKTEAVSAAVR